MCRSAAPPKQSPPRPRPTPWALGLLALTLLAPPHLARQRGDGPRLHRAVELGPDGGPQHAAVNEAIDRGVQYLLERQLRDGSWEDFTGDYGLGQTALCLFTLLKSGVEPSHPAIQSALVRLDAAQPTKVYSVSCCLLAYAALADPGRRGRVAELAEQLVQWQAGSFGYPGSSHGVGAGGIGAPADLSNTQFAALGLRAALQAGAKIPAQVWVDLLEATLEYQEQAVLVQSPASGERSSSGRVELAGFRYRVPPTDPGPGFGPGGGPGGPGGPGATLEATGSMTAAGIAVLEICREGLGRRIARKHTLAVERAQARALAWLVENFAVDRNPGGGHWLEYYLYGLERVGALLERERFGERAWYPEGALRLVRDQLRDGSWNRAHPESGTCFALLFLQRATAPRSGEAPDRRGGVYTSEGEVCLRGTGDNPLSLWITGFDEAALARAGVASGGPRVERVEYLVDGRVVATVRGDAGRPWNGERFAVRHFFERPGEHQVSARVHLRVGEGAAGERALLEAPPLAVDVSSPPRDWLPASARAAVRNLLSGVQVEVTASSQGSGNGARQALDGLQGTRWLASSADLQPTIRLELERSVRADELWLGGPDAREQDRGRWDTSVRARVTIDGREVHYVQFPADPLRPAVLRLERARPIGRLEIQLVERVPGSGQSAAVGLAEIVLALGP